MQEEVGAVAAKVGIREVQPAPGLGRHLVEAVEVELAHEAAEVRGLEGVRGRPCPFAARCEGAARAEQLPLQQGALDEQPLAAAVPAQGADVGAVHQLPQLGGEGAGVEPGGQRQLRHRADRRLWPQRPRRAA